MILINNTKAISIAKEKIRAWRTSEFSKNDLAIQNALLEGADTTALVQRRDYLRDLPAQCEGKTLAELEALIAEIGA